MTATIHRFPGKLVRIPPRVLGVYEGSVCKLVSVCGRG
jgi:hypothetical protein